MNESWTRFRFVDAQLQSRLIKAVQEANLTHRVATDGTLVYPPGKPVEDVIARIVDSVFPEG